ncbi:shikimate dehydrogenase [Oxynema sp. CENA135]|uniref:shikimate dehydrogenase n=1 Tax=Oxynema sp. CENA135 TaxID=984206 RepID=UPI00190CBEDC|nr:shikimate dehydrogenase [Oxynema sp. CENA135]MBK4730697.1 shikimate dehydrogenase [Oxynema sp. CENA135]
MQAITGKTKLLGVIGHPVEHSLSPVMHNAAIAALSATEGGQVDYVYLPFPVKPENLSAAVAGFEAVGLCGFNITIPHKQSIVAFLDEVSPVARAVGAVNTVWRTPTGWAGTNTDVEGFLSPLRARDRPWKGTQATILGAGGAARAIVAGCAELGCEEIVVVGRDRAKLDIFARSWEESPIAIAPLSTGLWEDLPAVLAQTDLLVNATPVGMHPQVDRTPVEASLLAQLPAGAIVYDLIYTPNPTRLLREARQVGAGAIDGLEMLVQQGAAALQLWLNRPVPVDVMRRSLQEHLGSI